MPRHRRRTAGSGGGRGALAPAVQHPAGRAVAPERAAGRPRLRRPHPPRHPLPQGERGETDTPPPSPLVGEGGGGVRGLTPKVADFGFALLLPAPGEAEPSALTHTHAVLGTPGYMAPELAAG